jgi:hypothetical protein
MKITIDIPDMHVKLLSQWASVGRTLQTANKACSEAAEAPHVSDTDAEMFRHCGNELDELIPALEELHRVARQAMWNIANRAKAIEALEKTTPLQRAKALAIMSATTNPQYHKYYDRIVAELEVSLSLWPEAVIDWLRSLDPKTWEVKVDA